MDGHSSEAWGHRVAFETLVVMMSEPCHFYKHGPKSLEYIIQKVLPNRKELRLRALMDNCKTISKLAEKAIAEGHPTHESRDERVNLMAPTGSDTPISEPTSAGDESDEDCVLGQS
jgi:hypothetical protein